MKLLRRLSAFTMVLALLLSLSISVWAVDYDAANVDDLFTAFGDTSGEDVNINVTADIDAGYYSFDAQEDTNYNIGSENGSTVGNIGFYGDGSVNVSADVEGEIYSYGDVDITVEGDVNGGVSASGDSSIAVDGDVDGYAYAGENAEVSVSGDVNGYVDAYGEGSVTVGGDVGRGVFANGSSNITVGGDVNGGDGNPDEVDYSDPSAYSDGNTGVYAGEDATVTVGGNVTGGDSYGTFGYGGTGVVANGTSEVTVGGDITGGNVTADPDTAAGDFNSMGGSGVQMESTATVTVGGNVTGGDTNGDAGLGGYGTVVIYSSEGEAGSVTVSGDVTCGEGEAKSTDLLVINGEGDIEDPSIVLGSVDSIDGYGFTEEELEALKEEVKANTTKTTPDTFWANVVKQIRAAQPGDEITIDVYNRMSISASVIAAVRECEVTLIIKWNGGEDLVIDKNLTAEVSNPILLKDLAELLKK